jgi:hypothetical protein
LHSIGVEGKDGMMPIVVVQSRGRDDLLRILQTEEGCPQIAVVINV